MALRRSAQVLLVARQDLASLVSARGWDARYHRPNVPLTLIRVSPTSGGLQQGLRCSGKAGCVGESGQQTIQTFPVQHSLAPLSPAARP